MFYHLVSAMPAVRSSESVSYRMVPTGSSARATMRNTPAITSPSPVNILRPLTRSRALGRRLSTTSQRFFPYIPSIVVSSSSLKFLRKARRASISTISTEGPGSDSSHTDTDDDPSNSLFGSSPTPHPPTSPTVYSDIMLSSPMSTTPGQHHATQPTTPDTPTPGPRRENGRKLQRTYAMRVSPMIESPVPASVPMDVGSDEERTPRVRVTSGMSLNSIVCRLREVGAV